MTLSVRRQRGSVRSRPCTPCSPCPLSGSLPDARVASPFWLSLLLLATEPTRFHAERHSLLTNYSILNDLPLLYTSTLWLVVLLF